MIQPQANAGKVIVRSQLAQALPPVVADERSIRQIMLNLLSNAAKFTDAGGQVVASTSLTDSGEVVIRVRDTGIGMAEDDVKRAMEPFRQIPGPRAASGTGLGLPLTKALAEANRAAFTLKSEPGKGTLVEVTFPSTRVLAE
jgi:signal transduction histidine kinase